MIFSTSKQNLLEQLNLITPILPSHSTKPITECIKMELEGDKLFLTATDLSITLITNVEVNGSEDGICVVQGKKFLSIIKKLPVSETIYIKKEKSSLKISSGSAKFEVVINEDHTEFPTKPVDLTANKFEIDSLKLKKYISKTAFAISTDELRAVLTGVLFSVKFNELTMVATDSVRLVKLEDKAIKYEGEDIELIMPAKTLNAVSNSINSNYPVEVFFEENYAEFKMENITIFTRLINGKYPAYQAIIPVSNDKKARMEKSLTIQTVDRISLACNPLTRLIKFELKENAVLVAAEDASTSSKAEENLKIDYSEEEMVIGFNASKLMDLLKNIDTMQVVFEISNAGKPIIIKPVDSEDSFDILSLIMPVKVTK